MLQCVVECCIVAVSHVTMTIRKHNVDTHHKHNTTDCNRLQQTATDCNTLQRNTVPAESCASATSTRVTSSWAESTSHKCVRYLPSTRAHRKPGSPDIATSLLKNAVACCSVLQCVAVCCSVMQSVTSTRNSSTHRWNLPTSPPRSWLAPSPAAVLCVAV